ncbi:MAG: Holliday junction branch migration protein RuvA [Peptococcaceae bacterium]|nr:Holliday junction branch migration protein RuvA [Peptococcaceae bacterium]
MIGFLKGTIVAAEGQMVTVLVGGVGFEVMMPNDGETLFNIGDEVDIHTYMHVRENEIGLYGFSSSLEKKLFNVLIGVSGIGPKSAMQMLGVATPQGIITAISAEDEKLLSSLPGIGKKTAARLILELKEKIVKEFPLVAQEAPVQQTPKKATQESAIEKDLSDALIALGYRSHEIKEMYEATDVLEENDVNVALRKALQYLSRG